MLLLLFPLLLQGGFEAGQRLLDSQHPTPPAAAIVLRRASLVVGCRRQLALKPLQHLMMGHGMAWHGMAMLQQLHVHKHTRALA